jgi:hypothetical protein
MMHYDIRSAVKRGGLERTIVTHRIPNRLRFLTAAFLLASGCAANTHLQTAWKAPVAGPLAFKKVAVVALNGTPGERRAEEDEIAGLIQKANATPSHTFVTDDELTDREKVKAKIIAGGFDGAVVLRLLDSKKQTNYIPDASNYWQGVVNTAPYYGHGMYVTDTIIRAEISVYSVPDGKLIWVGSSTTANPENVRSLASQVAQAAAAELKKQGLLE